MICSLWYGANLMHLSRPRMARRYWYEWVMSHTRLYISHVSHMIGSCGTVRTCVSRDWGWLAGIDMLWHLYGWRIRVAHINESKSHVSIRHAVPLYWLTMDRRSLYGGAITFISYVEHKNESFYIGRHTEWRWTTGCLICIGYSLQKSAEIRGSFAERDLQVKAFYARLPPCISHEWDVACIFADIVWLITVHLPWHLYFLQMIVVKKVALLRKQTGNLHLKIFATLYLTNE